MNNLKIFDTAGFNAMIKALPKEVGAEAVTFFKNRFQAQAWTDTSAQRWTPRKSKQWGKKDKTNRALLIDTGRLRNSVRITSANQNSVTIGTPNVKYAAIHNEGYKGAIQQIVREHKRRKTIHGVTKQRTSKKGAIQRIYGRVDTGQTIDVKQHNRTINVDIPKRQFMGKSALLDRKIKALIDQKIKKFFK